MQYKWISNRLGNFVQVCYTFVCAKHGFVEEGRIIHTTFLFYYGSVGIVIFKAVQKERCERFFIEFLLF